LNKTIHAQEVIGSRLLGPEYTFITTTLAPQKAKKLSSHPDFAAVVVQWLTEAGVGSGQRVAVNFSGSFPALNIAVLSAISAVGAEPVIVSSIGASTWGATDPGYTWLDMEKELQQTGLWNWRSAAASLGGVWDRGGGLTPEGKKMAMSAILRNEVPVLEPATLQEAVDRRVTIYRGATGHLPDVLVNVGGNHVIFGEAGHSSPLPQGLNIGYHPLLSRHDGLAAVFLQSNRPVIHLINIAQIAAKYGIADDTGTGRSSVFLTRALPLSLRVLLVVWIAAIAVFLWRGRQKVY
jgi:poly-gamma-glutamate system protein